MRRITFIVLIFCMACLLNNVKGQVLSSSLLNGYSSDNSSFSNKTYTEAYFTVGRGYTIGLNRIKDLSPRMSMVVGASYTNFRGIAYNYEQYALPSSIYSLRTELRYYLLPKDKPLTAFAYASVNNAFYTLPGKSNINLGLEVGGEVRYKISDNASFSVRTSFYRQNGGPNPYFFTGNPYR